LARLLLPLAWLYGLLLQLRKAGYQHGWLKLEQVPVPLVVIGNLVAGGSGKTPVVMALVKHWQARGLQVGVISRGYGRSGGVCLEVRLDSKASEVGDEPALIKRNTRAPAFVAARRIEAARALLTAYPHTQVILSDDGLQHLAMGRNFEIGVFDDRGVGNGYLLPAGPLREPWPRPLDVVLHTGATPAFAGWRAVRRLQTVAHDAQGQQVALATLEQSMDDPQEQPLLALAAIAQPEAFFAMLRAAGLSRFEKLALPDHDDFSHWNPADYVGYRLVCTEKDAVKLWAIRPDALAVGLDCILPNGLFDLLDARVDQWLAQTPALR
jgi:tetraacyldisaccharide 4'-kinase